MKDTTHGYTKRYLLDGAKIVGENWSFGNKKIRYLYDITGVAGFVINDGKRCYYVKDAQGNVVSISDASEEVASYEYDAWGNCTITKDTDGLGTLNPFRWKSLYYDTESNLYAISTESGTRYYDPATRIYLSPRNIETVLASAGTVCGLNLYTVTLDNPMNMLYNEYTIETAYELMYDPPPLSGWEQFWRGPWGKVLAVVILYAATMLAIYCPAFIPFYISGLIWTAVGLGVSGAIAGYRSWSTGHGFWNGLGQALNNEWSSSFAIGMAVTMVTFGVCQAVQAIRGAINAKTRAAIAQMTPEQIAAKYSQEDLARIFTHNPNSKTTVIGKWDDGGPTSYVNYANSMNPKAAYFSMPDSVYNGLMAKFGSKYMLGINEAFITQRAAVSTFAFSHSIKNVTVGTSFWHELRWLNLV